MKLSIVGTSNVAEQMLASVKLYPELELDVICSRSFEKGKTFVQQYGFKKHVRTVEELAQTDTDAVYVASPNSCHYHQAKELIQQGKHILLEKPFTSNSSQAKELIKLAESNNVVLMEAVVIPFLPNFQKLKEIMPPKKEIIRVNLACSKVSSKIDSFLMGEKPNIFSSEMSGGSLMDLGVYGAWFAVALWGEPKNISYHSLVKVSSGLDGKGILVLSYQNFDVEIVHSKISNDGSDVHIYTKQRHIIGCEFSVLSKIIDINTHLHTLIDKSVSQPHSPFYYELGEFIRCITKKHESSVYSLENTIIVMNILDEARKQNNIVFPDDFAAIDINESILQESLLDYQK